MILLSVTHIASNRPWAENQNLLFDSSVERTGVVYMVKIHKVWVKQKLILWTFWVKYSLGAQVSPEICSPKHFLTPLKQWHCLHGCPIDHLHIHIFTVTSVPHENAAVLWQRASNNCSPVLLWGGKYWLLSDESLVTQRVCRILHSPIAVMLLKVLDCRPRGCPMCSWYCLNLHDLLKIQVPVKT